MKFFVAIFALMVASQTYGRVLTAVEKSDLEDIIERGLIKHDIPGAQVQIFEKSTDKLIYEYYSGSTEYTDSAAKKIVRIKNTDRRGNPTKPIMPIASASKMATAYLILLMVEDGVLSLEDTTGKILGWKGEIGKVNVRDLLSFTSGIPGEFDRLKIRGLNNCKDNIGMSLQQCAEYIYTKMKAHSNLLLFPSGSGFDYGANHMIVSGSMAEVAYNRKYRKKLNWNQLYDKYVKTPLKINKESKYYANPGSKLGDLAALPSGGLIINIDDYAKILKEIKRKTSSGKFPFKEMFKDQFKAHTKIIFSPYYQPNQAGEYGKEYKFHYGFGNWRECLPSEPKCAESMINSSAGMFGFVPFVDQKGQYYGIFAGTSNKRDAATRAWLVAHDIINYLEKPVNHPPVLAEIGNIPVDFGKTLNFKLNGSDPDKDKLTYSCTEGCSGVSVNKDSGQVSWKPKLSDRGKTRSITFRVSDGKLSNSKTTLVKVSR